MNKNLMRVEVSYGYDCKRMVNVTRYAGEVTAEGKAYRDPSKKNRMSEIKLGEIWVTYDDDGLTPLFKADAIVEDNGEEFALPGIIIKMVESIKKIMEFSANGFVKRVSGIGITSAEAKDDFERAMANTTLGGRVKVDLHSCAECIMKRAFDAGCILCGQYKVEIPKWQEFFQSQLTIDMIINILRNSPVVKCSGDFADFENDDAREEIESKFSLKIASDAIVKMTSEQQGK